MLSKRKKILLIIIILTIFGLKPNITTLIGTILAVALTNPITPNINFPSKRKSKKIMAICFIYTILLFGLLFIDIKYNNANLHMLVNNEIVDNIATKNIGIVEILLIASVIAIFIPIKTRYKFVVSIGSILVQTYCIIPLFLPFMIIGFISNIFIKVVKNKYAKVIIPFALKGLTFILPYLYTFDGVSEIVLELSKITSDATLMHLIISFFII